MKRVIDADNLKQIGRFEEKDAETVKLHYESLGIYQYVEFDNEGDLIVSEDD